MVGSSVGVKVGRAIGDLVGLRVAVGIEDGSKVGGLTTWFGEKAARKEGKVITPQPVTGSQPCREKIIKLQNSLKNMFSQTWLRSESSTAASCGIVVSAGENATIVIPRSNVHKDWRWITGVESRIQETYRRKSCLLSHRVS